MSSSPRKPPEAAVSFDIQSYGQESLAQPSPLPSSCAWCKAPFTRYGPPVLLKSGHRVHIECYYELRRPVSGPPN